MEVGFNSCCCSCVVGLVDAEERKCMHGWRRNVSSFQETCLDFLTLWASVELLCLCLGKNGGFCTRLRSFVVFTPAFEEQMAGDATGSSTWQLPCSHLPGGICVSRRREDSLEKSVERERWSTLVTCCSLSLGKVDWGFVMWALSSTLCGQGMSWGWLARSAATYSCGSGLRLDRKSLYTHPCSCCHVRPTFLWVSLSLFVLCREG